MQKNQGMIEGFRFTMDARENHQFLPLNRHMYFRHSMVECLPSVYGACSTSGSDATSSQEDRMILELLLRQNEVKDRLVGIMQKLYQVKIRIGWSCKDAMGFFFYCI